jgi:MFS family permease
MNAALIRLVITAHLGIALGLSPLPFYTLSVLAPALHESLNLPVSVLMSGLSVMTVTVVLLGPWVGRLADRFGVRRVASISCVAFGVSLMAFALNQGSVWQYCLHWLILSVAGLGTMPAVWIKSLNQVPGKNRAQIFAWALCGTGVCALLLPAMTLGILHQASTPLLGVDLKSWQWAYIALGALPILVVWPLILAMPAPTTVSHQIDGDEAVNSPTGIALNDAVKTSQFWLIGLAFLPIAFAVGGPIPNLALIFKQHGMDEFAVKSALPLLGFFVIAGRLLGGWLMDRFFAPRVACVLFALPLLAMMGLVFATSAVSSSVMALFVVAGLGLSIGLEYDLLAFLVVRYFGQKAFGAIYASLYSAFALGAGFAAAIYAAVNEKLHSYDAILLLGALGMAMGAVLLLRLGAYRYTY